MRTPWTECIQRKSKRVGSYDMYPATSTLVGGELLNVCAFATLHHPRKTNETKLQQLGNLYKGGIIDTRLLVRGAYAYNSFKRFGDAKPCFFSVCRPAQLGSISCKPRDTFRVVLLPLHSSRACSQLIRGGKGNIPLGSSSTRPAHRFRQT